MRTEPELKALVIDDDAVVRQLTMRALARGGFRCAAARDGVDASRQLNLETYDVIVSDLRMPNCNGHTLAVKVLSEAVRPGFVVLTGISNSKITNDLMMRGVDGIAGQINKDVFFGLNLL